MRNSFIENKAKLDGGAIKRTNRFITKINNIFINNTAKYGPDEASIPINIMLKVYKKTEGNEALKDSQPIYSSYNNSERLHLYELNSGEFLSYIFHFDVVDHYDQIVTTLDGG